ncbi:serine/threonine-protein kinase [Marinitenerispora sediminis]|uniref:serine/threonine-protein kinase n=1 Tax=Marinitenerispora sediminis TaxID=1931232 RepID=UPI000DF222B8|nr:serine/threonine-protein kinase [Marinitenerispora sediminis]RCV54656.1 serine/threonine protein kinase [Marinitenerispora sediminis]
MTSNGHERIKPLRTGDPHELGGYRLLGRLGRGGMGTVYLAEDTSGRLVAVKLIHPDLSDDEDFRRRFAREVRSARRVARFSTAAVLDARLDGDPLFIVSEYVPGPNLAQAVAADGPMRGGTLESLAMGVAAALAAIHGTGIVHRDLKPANVLLSSVGPKVIDFGIARAMDDDSAVTRSSQLMGTPAYLAPELVLGQDVTPASDIFSWGCLVAYAGTGKAPFDAPTVPAVLHRISSGEPDLGGLDPEMRDLVLPALEKDPARRPTAQQLLNRLFGQEDPAESVVDQTVVRSWTPPSTARPADLAAAGLAGAAGAAAGPGDSGTPTADLSEVDTRAMPDGPADRTGSAPPQHPQPTSGPQPGFGGAHQPTSGPQPPVGGAPGGGSPVPPPGGAAVPGGARVVGASALAVIVVGAAVIGGVRLLGGPGVPEGSSVYTDDFLRTDTGWYSNTVFNPDDESSDGGYYEEQFALRVSAEQQSRGEYAPVTEPRPDRVLVSVDAVTQDGPDYSLLGLRCFHLSSEDGPGSRYEALVRFDGTGAQVRRDAGDNGGNQLAATDSVRGFDTDEGAVNNLAMSCELDGEAATMTINLWVNGRHVLEAVDNEPLPDDPENGRQVGITVQRGGGGGADACVFFDNFALHRLGEDEPDPSAS